ncbi:MAG: kynureninase, partial [Chloroflexi bacterium]
KRPFDFELAPIDLREDNYRLLNGTFGIPSLYAIQPGVDIIAEIGIDAIRAKNVRQTAILVEKALEAGYTVRTPLDPEARGGMIVIDMPHSYEISRELMARDFQLDWRNQAGIRISPHFYNTDDEIHAVMDEIATIIKTGAWEQHATQRTFVT